MSTHQVEAPRDNDPEWSRVRSYQEELDTYYLAIRKFPECDPSSIFNALAAFSARASEIRSNIMRNETRRLQAFRTRELDPFISSLDFQFKVYSRAQSVRQLEADISRGAI